MKDQLKTNQMTPSSEKIGALETKIRRIEDDHLKIALLAFEKISFLCTYAKFLPPVQSCALQTPKNREVQLIGN